MRKQFNTRLFLILLGSATVLSLSLFVVHWLQKGRIASALLFQAKRAEEQGQLDQTSRYLGRYLEFQPADAAERANLGRVLASAVLDAEKPPTHKARQRALFVLEQVVAQDGSREDLRRQLIKVALMEGRTDLALQHLKSLPQDGESWETIGKCHETDGKFVEAAAAYWSSIQADEKRLETYSKLATVLKRPNLGTLSIPIKTAEEVLDLMVSKNGDRFEARILRWKHRPATLYKDAEQLKKAAADVLQAIKLAPEEADSSLAAGELALCEAMAAGDKAKAGDQYAEQERAAALTRARDQLTRAIKRHPHESRLYLTLAQVEISADKTDAALDVLDQGLKALPNSFDLLWMQANVLLDNGKDPTKLSRAKTVLEQLTQTKGTPVAADYLHGRLALLAGNWREASQKLESVRIALDRDQASSSLLNQVDLYLARCYEQIDELGLRQQALDRVVKRTERHDPNSPTLINARRDLVSALISQGRFDDAILHIEKTLKEPSAPKSQWTELARALMARNLARGLNTWDDVQKALDNAPADSIDAHMLQLRVLVFKNEIKQAQDRVEKVCKSFPKHVEPWLAKANLAELQKEPAKVREILTEAEQKLGDRVELRLAWAGHWARQPKPEAEPALNKLAERADSIAIEEDRARFLRGLVEAFYRAGMKTAAQKVWGQVAALPSYQSDLRVKQVLFDLALENKDWPTIEAVVEDIRRVEGPNGPVGSFALALKQVRKAETANQAPPAEAREALDRLAVARPKWAAVHMARAEVEVRSKNYEQAVMRLREAVAAGEARNPQVVYQLVGLLRQLGRIEEANRELRNLPAQALDTDLQWMATELALRGQNHAEAVRRAMSAVPKDSQNYLDYLRLGTAFMANGQKEEAEKNLRLAIKLGDKEPEAWVALCQFLLAQKRKPEAQKVADDAVAALPADVKVLAQARFGELLGEPEKAKQFYLDALKQKPDHVPTLKAVVNYQIRSGQLVEVEPLLRSVMDGPVQGTEADKLWARRGLALVQAARGDFRRFGEALAYVDLRFNSREGKVLENDPPPDGFSVEDRRVQAQVLATQPQKVFRQKAIDCLLEVERKGALTLDDRFLLARIYETEKATAKAREQWLALVNAQSTNPVYLNGYADHLLRSNQVNEAGLIIKRLEEVEKAQKVEAGKFGSVELMARMLEGRGDGAKALEMLQTYIARPGSKPEEVFGLVSSLARQKKVDEALALCEKCWSNCPPEAVSGASVALLRAADQPTPEQIAKVQNRVEEASKKSPNSLLFLLHLADINDLKGDYPKAQAMYRQVLEKDAKNAVALNNLAWLISQTSGDSNEALQLIGKAIDGLGERPELLDTRASIYLAQKQVQQAITDLERANADARSEARSFRLAQAYLLANDRTNAAKVFKEAQQAGLKPEQLHPIEQKAFRQLLDELKPQ